MSDKNILDSPLANVASEIEERRCDLIDRHRHLRDKIITMERSIPALIAYNMWMTCGRDCRDAPYRKVREIINKLAPQPDPVDKLLAELKSTVNDLHQETTQLHDNIIDADVKLEETTMELESLELANKEMEGKLVELRKKVQKHSTPSLHSIHSEDLICLKKIRQLAKEELKLKNCIKELKGKETMCRWQMKQLLSCKKFQRDKDKIMGCMKRLQGNREFESQKRNKACLRPTSMTLTANDRIMRKIFQDCRLNSCEKLCPPFPCCVQKLQDCRISRQPISSCESFNTVSKTGTSKSTKQLAYAVPCEPDKTCNGCETPNACKWINSCKCDCEGKCKRELSTAPCNCCVTSLTSIDKTTRQSKVLEVLRSESEVIDSSDEFCECCSCGCEDSENSSENHD